MEILGLTFSKSFVIFVSALFIWILSQVFSTAFVVVLSTGNPTGKRLRTLNNLVRALASAVIVVVAAFMILREFGFDVTPLLASAGIAGIALGFGAQTLVKDIISGAFILVENQFDEGDTVEISSKKGIVERITLRSVFIREKNGVVHIIPNGSITMVSNFSKKN